jgi:hypothetical protein
MARIFWRGSERIIEVQDRLAVFEKNTYYFDRGVDDLQCFRISFRVPILA